MTTFILAGIAEMLVHAFAIMQLWNWFVVPSLKAPALTLVPATGISLLISVFTFNPMDDNVEKMLNKGIGRSLFDSFAMPSLYLIVGWILSWFM